MFLIRTFYKLLKKFILRDFVNKLQRWIVKWNTPNQINYVILAGIHVVVGLLNKYKKKSYSKFGLNEQTCNLLELNYLSNVFDEYKKGKIFLNVCEFTILLKHFRFHFIRFHSSEYIIRSKGRYKTI